MKFSDVMGNTRVFDLETTEDISGDNERMPVKLGDGNFGCVLAARGGNELLALKIIYEHQATTGNGSDGDIDYKKLRTLSELRVKETLFERLNSSPDEEVRKLTTVYDEHLALPLAYSMKLDQDEEFEEYASIYRKYDLVFSRYAYVMRRFDCSLKDLMEHGGRVSFAEADARRTAYARLRSVSLAERERSALPVISQVANGLRILHAAGLRHQDIKPANIYYRNNLGTADFVLGDLGFLHEQNPIAAGSAMVSSDALVIGTKHYRSIEQIDHSDVSEVWVEPGPDGETITVASRDPKFLRTNIRAGDLVVFPRSSSQTLFKINEFRIVGGQGDEASPEVRMTISSADRASDEERGDAGLLSLRDGLTQASFIKNPTERTDLFGLGAVLFDIVSAGESAERFYELLRKYDVRDTRIQQTILNFYPTWRSGQAVTPDISAIFQRASNDGREYLSPGIMAFLLNCMMSEPDDSFYMRYFEHKDGQPDSAGWPAVISSIEGLVRRLRAQDYRGVDKNALTAEKPSSDTEEDPPSRETIGDLLPSLQEREPIDRWLRAASFLNAMMELTRRISSKLGSSRHTTAFISLKPEHLVLSRDDQIIKESDVVGRYTNSQYLGQLMVLDPLFSSLSSDPNSFLPVWWQSRLRRVFVRPWPNEDGAESTGEAGVGTGGAIRVATRSIDFSMPGQRAQAGDFLLVSNEESTHSLYDIEESGNGWLEIRRNEAVEAERENIAVESRHDEDRSGYIVKSLDTDAYLGGMLSIYLFHALFAGGEGRGVEHFGREVISKALYYPMTDLPGPSESPHQGWGGRIFGPQRPEEHELVRHAIRLYVWLMLGGFHGAKNRMDAIKEQVSKWKDRVAGVLGRRADEVDHLIFRYAGDDYPAGTGGIDDALHRSLQVDEATWERVARSYLAER